MAVDYQQLFSRIEGAGAVPYASSEALDDQHAVFRLRKKMSGIPAAASALKTGAGGYAWIE